MFETNEERHPPVFTETSASVRNERFAALDIDPYNPADDPLVKTSVDLVGEFLKVLVQRYDDVAFHVNSSTSIWYHFAGVGKMV